VPTELNLRALVSEYGENGFQEPNMNVPVNYNPYTDTKYYCNPLPCEPQKANSPPIANAGVDQSPDAGAKVTLDGTKSSDSDGTITSYSWHQLAGPGVKLYKPTSPNPYFYVPSPLETSTKLSFELTVTDDKGFNAADTVNIKANVQTTEQEKTNTTKKSTAPNNIEQDIFKVVVRLANIRQELGYDNSAILLKGNLFQKQELSYLIANNSTIAETTFAFPSTLIKTGESFVVCVKQSSIKGEEGIECKIGVNSPPIGTVGLNFTLPQSGKLASDSITIPQINYNTQAVKIVDGASSPNNQKHLVPFFVKVSKGDHVVWKNEDSVTHTITSGSPKGTNSGSIFNSGNLASGKIFEYTFIKPGKYDYYCKIHPFIIGEISVN